MRGLPAFLLLILAACSRQAPPPEVSLGAQISVQDALVWIARDAGYFRQEGVRVKLRSYPSGRRALEGMLANQVELAVVAETPLAVASWNHPGLRIYATLGRSDNNICLLARRDHGIRRPADLRGKRVATQRGSAVHFFLSSFLLDAGLTEKEVEIRFLEVEELAPAFGRGEVDAISMRDPVLEQAEALAGRENTVRFCVPGLYTKSYNLVGWQDYYPRHPEVIEGVLRALERAAALAREDPARAQHILNARLQLDPKHLAQLWSGVDFRLSLNQALLVSLQEEARWAATAGIVEKGVGQPHRVPDLLGMIDVRPLQKVLSQAVGLVGLEGEGG